MIRFKRFIILFLAFSLLPICPAPAPVIASTVGTFRGQKTFGAHPIKIEIVSVASDGTLGDDWINDIPSVSADGRYVEFVSLASNLVEGDSHGENVFVHDRLTGETVMASVSSEGNLARVALFGNISADGRYVTFYSNDDSLVPGDPIPGFDGFIHDQVGGETSRIPGHGEMSADGQFIVFSSPATNLVAGDTNLKDDIFVYDRLTEEIVRVSVSSDGTQGDGYSSFPTISSDGRYVVFISDSTNLVAGDTNGVGDTFVHDRLTGETTRVSIGGDGTQANNASWQSDISGDGRFVAFSSSASNLVSGDTNEDRDVFVHDRVTGGTIMVSAKVNNGMQGIRAWEPSISEDGRLIAFTSWNNTNSWQTIFVYDQLTGKITEAAVNADGEPGNLWSAQPDISDDGRYLAFVSLSSNLVPGDTNNFSDVFVVDLDSLNISMDFFQLMLPLIIH